MDWWIGMSTMPTDYAPRTTTRKASWSKQPFSATSFGGGALFGAALVLALIYAPALFGSGADEADEGEAGEEPAPPPTMPALTYEFMDRLPKEQVVTNVTPYEPPPRTDAPDVEAAIAAIPAAGDESKAAQGDADPTSEPPVAGALEQARAPENAGALAANVSPQATPPQANIRPAPNRPRQATSEDMEYMLQAASLRSREDADALRARLILDGLSAPVQVVRHPDGGARHRVLVGPFAEEEPMRRVQETLRAKDIAALAMQRPR